MLKKRYVIIALVIVSVLLGSLFYSNIVLAQKGKVETHRDTVEITVMDWSSRQYSEGANPQEYGVALTLNFPIRLPFAFSPKQHLQNVTDLWIRFTAQNLATASLTVGVALSINDGPIISTNEHYPARNWGLKTVSTHITNPIIYYTIASGINKLTLTSPRDVLTMFKIVIFIEYEYQA